jgi:hypothetical protein
MLRLLCHVDSATGAPVSFDTLQCVDDLLTILLFAFWLLRAALRILRRHTHTHTLSEVPNASAPLHSLSDALPSLESPRLAAQTVVQSCLHQSLAALASPEGADPARDTNIKKRV